MIQSITIIDGQDANPAKLQTQLEPVKLNQGMTMVITSFAYGEIYNIHDGNDFMSQHLPCLVYKILVNI